MGLWQSNPAEVPEWKRNIVTDPQEAIKIAGEAKIVAVLGIAPDDRADRPAHYVPKALHEAGVAIVPVPVYYPDVDKILGQKVIRKLQDIPHPVDILDVFRRSEDLPPHLDDILSIKPKVVWLQSGISNAHVEEQVARAGIKVVPDRCLMVDHRRASARL